MQISCLYPSVTLKARKQMKTSPLSQNLSYMNQILYTECSIDHIIRFTILAEFHKLQVNTKI
jgi:phosphoribosyl 1,2-cyclic phosphodiesterase